jgi:hypothetical protein
LLYVVIRGQTLVFDWHKNEFRFEYSSFSKLVPDRRQVPLPDEETFQYAWWWTRHLSKCSSMVA